VRAWTRPAIPGLSSRGVAPRIFDSSTGSLREARPSDGANASLYVCGITPYDATHLGHAATYLAYDTLIRVWLDAGFSVNYAQNVTDIDDPLLERADRDGVDWRELAASQTDLFRSDMQHLQIVPPNSYIAVTEVISEVAEAVKLLLNAGIAYFVDSADAGPDLYFDSAAASRGAPWQLGDESSISRDLMLQFSAERGGDPERPGKRDKLDPLLWRAERVGEPAWDSAVGRGRPGWHIECSVIAQTYLDTPLTVNGGGSDLLFPHHEFSAGHTAALTGHALSAIYSHTGMVAYEGTKMSKSLGNLVFVSRLVAEGTDPRAIRLALLSEHYRSDWEWTAAHLTTAETRLSAWAGWAHGADAPEDDVFLLLLRSIIGNDLDTPAAIEAIDRRIAGGEAASPQIVAAIDALLGIHLAD
jgi:L-cysteine:1D-myo-inositol 2-amino-2-deoxy-alpha-D-glucopyranoside ligase